MPVGFTGVQLQQQSNLQMLSLCEATELTTEGLQHVVAVLPSLVPLDFSHVPTLGLWRLPQEVSLLPLAEARCLQQVSLKGLSNVSLAQVQELELAIRAQGQIGLAQPKVLLVLPQGACPWSANDEKPTVQIGSACRRVLCSINPVKTLEEACMELHRWDQGIAAGIALRNVCLICFAGGLVRKFCFKAVSALHKSRN